MPVADKVRLAQALAESGVDEVEVSSFVSPKWVPQLGDAAEVFAALRRSKPPGVVYSALVPNERGMEAALAVNAAGPGRVIDKIAVFTAASETFSQRNTNASIAETMARFRPVIAAARAAGLTTRGYISCVVRCPFEGDIAPAKATAVAQQLLELGIDEIDLGETIGAGTPENIAALLDAVWPVVRGAALTLHLHDTQGRAAACASAALRQGVRSFDAAAGGLGGCPYASTPAQRAPGNIATEALLAAIDAAGGRTRVDRDRLAAAGRLARALLATD